MKKAVWQWMIDIALLVNAIISMIAVGRFIAIYIEMFTAEYFSMAYFLHTIYFFVSNCLQIVCLIIGFCYWIRLCRTGRQAAMTILKCGLWGTAAYLIPMMTGLIFAGQFLISSYMIAPVCVALVGLLCKYKGDNMQYSPLFVRALAWLKEIDMKRLSVIVICFVLGTSMTFPLRSQADQNSGTNLYVYDVSNFGKIRYQYFVLSHFGNVMDDGYLENQPPKATIIAPSCLMLEIPAGQATYYQFFDLDNEIVSSTYQQVVYAIEGYVLYTDDCNGSWRMILRSIFDSHYYKEYPIDLASVLGRVDNFNYHAETGECSITYTSNNNYQQKTISIFFPINEGSTDLTTSVIP